MNGIVVRNKVISKKDEYIPMEKFFELLPNPNNSFINSSKEVIKLVERELMKSSSLIDIVKESVPKTEYRAVFTDEEYSLLADGSVRLMTGNDGTIIAELVNTKNNQIYRNVRLEEIELTKNASDAVNQFSNRIQMAEFADKLKTIEEKIDQILLERKLKRKSSALALLYSLEQAMQMKDDNLRKEKLLSITNEAEKKRQELMALQMNKVKNILSQPTNFGEKILWNSFYSNANAIDDIRNEMRYISVESAVEYFAYKELGEDDAAQLCANRYCDFINDMFKSETDLFRLDGLDKFKGNYWSRYFPTEINNVISYLTNGNYVIGSIGENNTKFREQYINWLANTVRGAGVSLFTGVIAKEASKNSTNKKPKI